jgi:hypothetical protein
MLLDVEFVDSKDLVSEAEGVYGGGGLYVVVDVDVRGDLLIEAREELVDDVDVRDCEGGKYAPSWAASMASMGEAGIVVEFRFGFGLRLGLSLRRVFEEV